LAGSGPNDKCDAIVIYRTPSDDNPPLPQVFELLIHHYSILPVVAIGNENHGNSSSPGNAYNAFSVGAVESTGVGKVDVAFFSSGASLVFPGREPGIVTKPDVVAPGAQIYSCVPPDKQPDRTYIYAYSDSSAMAAPHVTGAAALLMAAVPGAPVTEVMEALKVTAKHLVGRTLSNRSSDSPNAPSPASTGSWRTTAASA
jgi:subtilisin family serine protease